MLHIFSIKKYTYLFALLALLLSLNISCNEKEDTIDYEAIIHSENVLIQNDDELKNFANKGITKIKGNLDIQGVSSLKELHNLRVIEGTLILYGNENLTSLHGLESLSTVGLLEILDNNDLNSLQGLEGLTSVRDYLLIWSNDNLRSLQGLEGLKSVGDKFSIKENKKLIDFCDLKNLTTNEIFIAIQNAYNPTLSQIQSGTCSN